MATKNTQNGKLLDFVNGIEEGNQTSLTAAQIATAYKAALMDFVQRKTNRTAIAEVSKLLAGALVARRQELMEVEETSCQRLLNYY